MGTYFSSLILGKKLLQGELWSNWLCCPRGFPPLLLGVLWEEGGPQGYRKGFPVSSLPLEPVSSGTLTSATSSKVSNSALAAWMACSGSAHTPSHAWPPYFPAGSEETWLVLIHPLVCRMLCGTRPQAIDHTPKGALSYSHTALSTSFSN